ncbi:right-handed parallel beta-helix repeat-containing protein [Chitinophaga arvensicola]|uniref:Right handed beta helix region n=1 Tax=Chitinophaga arvensicola TaxID=29529 RepID=A0A1I0RLS1_9BACT|nr:right-handed parallel beta-helix repeat-containing protein [Chitinophaga arvensicola]SEW42172.1 Right handed beta helix region [Chitinophaga arvensicola]
MTFDYLTQMKAYPTPPTDKSLVHLVQYHSDKPGGGGQFYWDPASVETANDGTIIKAEAFTTGRWKRLLDGEPINVKWFGATGEGVPYVDKDNNNVIVYDSTFINKAISAGYRDLYFPRGTYLFEDTAAIGSNLAGINLIGENRENTVLKKKGSSPTAIINGGGSNITIKGLSFTAPCSTVTNGLIEITSGDNIVIKDCSLTDAMRAFWLRCAPNSSISNVIFSENIIDKVKDGIIVGNIDVTITGDIISNIRITNNRITNGKGTDENTGGDGIKTVKKCTHLVISNNYIKGFVRDAIDLFASGDRVIISSNHLLNSGVKAMDIKANVSQFPVENWGNGGKNLIICDNIIEANATGISIARNVSQQTDFNYGIDVSHNQFLNNTQTSIQAYGKHINISNNFFKDNGTSTAGAYHCIQCGDNTLARTLENAIISENMFVNNGNKVVTNASYAIYVSFGSSNCGLFGNTVVNDSVEKIQRYGIYINDQTKGIKLRNNTIKDLDGANYTFINGAEIDNDLVAGSKDGFTLQNITATGNKTDRGIDHVFKTNANGLREILQPGDAFFLDNSSSVTGAVKITLPFGWNNTIMSVRLSGNNYNQGTGQHFDITVTGMNTSAGSGWTSGSAKVTGRNPFSSLVRLAYDGQNCCILIGDITTQWSRPKIWVQSVMTSYTGGAATWDAGWTSALLTNLTGITSIITPSLENYVPAAANGLATLDASGKIPAGQLPAATGGALLLEEFYTAQPVMAAKTNTPASLYSYLLPENILSGNGEKIIAEFAGKVASNANTKKISITVGNTLIGPFTPGTGDWLLKLLIIRTGPDSLQLRSHLEGNAVTLTTITGIDLSAPVRLELSNASEANNHGDITTCMGTIAWKAAGATTS